MCTLHLMHPLVPTAEEAVLPNTIYISSENEVIRPPAARTKGSDAYNSYVPAYNCSVVSNAPTHGVNPKNSSTTAPADTA